MAHAIVLAAEARLDGYWVFNVGEASTPTMSERAEQIAAAMSTTFRWEDGKDLPAEFGFLGDLPNDFVADTTRIREVLGYEEVLGDAAALADLVTGLRASRAPR